MFSYSIDDIAEVHVDLLTMQFYNNAILSQSRLSYKRLSVVLFSFQKLPKLLETVIIVLSVWGNTVFCPAKLFTGFLLFLAMIAVSL